jgi:hypothetical protein
MIWQDAPAGKLRHVERRRLRLVAKAVDRWVYRTRGFHCILSTPTTLLECTYYFKPFLSEIKGKLVLSKRYPLVH